MQAVVKSTSNGEPSQRQSRAELHSNVKQGVETCAESHRVVAGTKHSMDVGAEPTLLNGGHETRAHQRSNDSRRYSPILQATGDNGVSAANARRSVVQSTEHHSSVFERAIPMLDRALVRWN